MMIYIYTIDLNNDATTLALLGLIMDAGGVFFDLHFEVFQTHKNKQLAIASPVCEQ